MKFTDFLKEVSDCNCDSKPISEGLQYHIDNQKLLTENVYRPFSKKYFELFKEARELYKKGELLLTEEEEKLIKNTDLGEFGYYNGIKVPLDFPMSEEQLMEAKAKKKQPALNKPKRGGSKKFYVYVRKPGGGIKKVSFGDTSGLKAKINDPKARKSFAARHKCAQNKDRTSAGYWACRLPRYASMLGLKSSFTGYW
jgi:CRISPR/Cas system-associated endonuclease/helicase Cas3